MTENATSANDIRPVLHDETVADIRESMAYYTDGGKLRPFAFYFTTPEDDDYRYWEEKALGIRHDVLSGRPAAIDLAIRVFEDLGCEVDYGDTCHISFSQDRCWWSATYDRCFRDFGYTLPVSDDVESLALLVDYVAKGEIQMICIPA